jgi:hypothetical protein
VKGENLSLTYYSFSHSKLQVTRDVSPGPNLPKGKEPPHCGDIGWDRFLLRQFELQTLSFCPPYKLCDKSSFSICDALNRKNRELLGWRTIRRDVHPMILRPCYHTVCT